MENSIFPLYRKRFDGKTFYKIVSKKLFIEYQQIGKAVLEHEIHVKQYPEMLLVNDMIECKDEIYFKIEEQEFLTQIETKKAR